MNIQTRRNSRWILVRYVNENNERIMMDKLRRNPKSIARSAKKEKKPPDFIS